MSEYRRWDPDEDQTTGNGAANPDYIAPKLKTVDVITLQGQPVPPRQWLVGGWVPHHNVTLFGGDGGLGKSLAAMQLATCCALGRDWFGLKTMNVKALYVACEDDQHELHRRQAAINQHHDVDFADLENLQWAPRVGEENALLTPGKFDAPGETTDFFFEIHNLAENSGAQLIILDSLHDLFAGNENARPQARQFIGLLRRMAVDCDATVVLLAHPSASGLQSGSGTAGSTAWNNAVRSRLYLTREDGDDADPDLRFLTKKKANYGGLGDGIRLRWQDGVFIRENANTLSGSIERSTRQKAAEDAFMRCLDVHLLTNRPASPSRNAQTFAPKIFTRMSEANGISMRRLDEAMEVLLREKKITVGTITTSGRKQRESVVRTEKVNP